MPATNVSPFAPARSAVMAAAERVDAAEVQKSPDPDFADLEARIAAALDADFNRPAQESARLISSLEAYVKRTEERLARREKELEIKVADLRADEQSRRAAREADIRAIKVEMDRDDERTAAAIMRENAEAHADLGGLRRNIAASRAFLAAAADFDRANAPKSE